MSAPFPRIHWVVGPGGAPRTAFLASLLDSAPAAPRAKRLDRADLCHGGVWGPVAAWLGELLSRLDPAAAHAPLLLARQRELALVLPELTSASLAAKLRLSLAESSQGGKRVRMFAADRVNRTIHGLVEVLAALARQPGEKLVLAWDGYEEASVLCRRLLLELAQRFGHELGLHLILTAGPEPGPAPPADLEKALGEAAQVVVVAADGTGETARASPSEAAEKAAQLQAKLQKRLVADQPILFQLLAWREIAGDRRALRETLARLAICLNGLSYYEDALPVARRLAPDLGLPDPADPGAGDEAGRARLLIGLYGIFVATGNAGEALELLSRAEQGWLRRADLMASLQYMLAMLHARYLPTRRLDLAQAHLETALELLEGSPELPAAEQRFQKAFVRNGLALVFYRRGEHQRAIDVCRENLACLDQEFAAGEHLLFCSVLYQNLALVEAARGDIGAAFEAYGQAIAIDPAYPEYYNDRASLALKVGRPDLALPDYLRAVEIGPPFAESFANLGQTYRALQQLEAAVAAYTSALELAPELALARIGRAQSLRLLGDNAAALRDYDLALEQDPGQALVWANRGAIHYFERSFAAALADFDEAIRQDPALPALHRNRALVLEALERADAAAEARRHASELERQKPPDPAPPMVLDSAEFHAAQPPLQ